jgi:hypothetical protein
MEDFDSLFLDFADELLVPEITLPEPEVLQSYPQPTPNMQWYDDSQYLQAPQNMAIPFIIVNMTRSPLALTPATPIDELQNMNLGSRALTPQSPLNSRRRSVDVQLNRIPLNRRDANRRHSISEVPRTPDASPSNENAMPMDMIEQIKRLPGYDEPLFYFADSPTEDKVPANLSKIKKPNRMCRSGNSTPITPQTPGDSSVPKYLVSVARKPRKKKQDAPEHKFMNKFSLRV